MDDHPFDRLTQTFAARLPRRRFGRLGAAALAALGLAPLAGYESAADKGKTKTAKHRRQDRREGDRDADRLAAAKNKKKPKSKKKPPCKPSCAGKPCGAPNGCGSICTTGSCPPQQVCDNWGRCQPAPCPNGGTRCGEVCLDTRSDPANCMWCNNRCREDQICEDWLCRPRPCDFERDENAKTMTLRRNCGSGETIVVPAGWTLDGNARTISLTGPLSGFTKRTAILADSGEATVRNLKVVGDALSGACGPDAIALVRFDHAGGRIEDVELQAFSDWESRNFRHCGTGIATSGDEQTRVTIVRATMSGVDTAIGVDGATATIEQCDVAGEYVSTGIDVHGGSASLIANHLQDVYGTAVRFAAGATGTIGPNNTVSGWTGIGLEGEGTEATIEDNSDLRGSVAISVREGASATIRRNTTPVGYQLGIESEKAKRITIADNEIKGYQGMRLAAPLDSPTTIAVTNNTIEHSSYGIETQSATGVIEDNVVTASSEGSWAGIHLGFSNVTVRRNTIAAGAGSYGLEFQGPGSRSRAEGNRVSGASRGAHVSFYASADLVDNTFVGIEPWQNQTVGIAFDGDAGGSAAGNAISAFDCGIGVGPRVPDEQGNVKEVTVGENHFPAPGVETETCEFR